MIKILCVDALDLDLVKNWDFSMPHQKGLEIPKGCYVSSKEYPKPHPHTWLVWVSMFTGVEHKEFPELSPKWKKFAYSTLHKLGVNLRKRRPRPYRTNPSNIKEKTIFTDTLSFTWNLPTINPEWIAQFPGTNEAYEYGSREFMQYLALGEYPKRDYDIFAIYTRYIDLIAHQHKKGSLNHQDLKELYYIVFEQANRLSETDDRIILVSDHGNKGGPYHTDTAYIGSNKPIPDTVKNILDFPQLTQHLHKEEKDRIEIDDKMLENRLKKLGYLN